MSSFPSTSSDVVDLRKGNYDFKAVIDAITAAIKGKVPPTEPFTNPSLFHIHTLSVQCPVAPLEPQERYPDGMRDNPDYDAMTSIIAALQDTTEACVPLTLLPPSPDVIKIPFGKLTGRKKVAPIDQSYSANIIIPKSKRKQPIIQLSRILFGHGRHFLMGATAWDTHNWLHAALALSPSQDPTRGNAYRDEHERVHLRTGLQAVWVPMESTDIPELKLIVTVDAYLDMSLIDQPLPPIGDDLYRMILASFFPPELPTPTELGTAGRALALREFYDCLRPAPDLPIDLEASVLQPPGLEARLLPFQRRTVAHLLHNEGAELVGLADRKRPPGQWMTFDIEGHGKYAFCRLSGDLRVVTEDRKGKGRASLDGDGLQPGIDTLPSFFSTKDVRGTMLCEEMGLGKTMEAIALMLLNRHPLSSRCPSPVDYEIGRTSGYEVDLSMPAPGHEFHEIRTWVAKEHKSFQHATSWSEEAELNVAEVGATLVVTPLPLLKQWISELRTHAPSLRVCVYPGWSGLIKQVEAKRKAAVKAHQKRQANELKRKNTKFRNETRRKYARSATGRIQIEDEDEDGEDSDSDDDDPTDDSLDSLLQATQRTWLDYVRSHDVVITTYQVLGDDLKVAHPAPKRSRRSTAKYNLEERPRSPLVMVEWFRVIMDEVQLQGDQSDAANMVSLLPRKNSLAMSGTPARNDVRDLIGSLRFLRVPDIGRVLWHRLMHADNRPSLHGLFKSLAVRTTKVEVAHEFNIPAQHRYIVPIELSEIEQHYYQDTLDRQRERLRYREDIGTVTFRNSLRHLRQICTHIQVGALARAGNMPMERGDRIQLGRQLMTMEEALKKMRTEHEATYVDNVKKQMRAMLRKAQLLVMDDKDPQRNFKALALYNRVRVNGQKILEPARAQHATLTADREDSVEADLDKNASQSERDRIKQIMAASSLIRETMLLIHMAWFLEGDAHHVLKDEAQEVAAYDTALALRNEILARPLKHTNAAVEWMVATLEKNNAVIVLEDLVTEDVNLRGGINSMTAAEQVNSLLDILNDNGTLVFSWRQKIIGLLQRPLEAEDNVPAAGDGQDVEDPDREYYAEALKSQGEVDAYFTAYAAALADRKEMLLEERTLLEANEGRVTKKRTTRTAREAAADAIEIPLDDVKDLTDKLMRERQAFRDRREEEDCTRPLKSYLIQIGNIVHGAYRAEEIEIARGLASTIRKYVTQQSERLEKLTKELDMFRATYNKRVTYYAALQEISDSVAVPEFQNLQNDIHKTDMEVTELEGVIANNIVKGRYLSFLDKDHDKKDIHEDCSICFGTSDDEFAILLACGHAFCVSCFRELRKSQYIGSKCPTCKEPIEKKAHTKIRIRPENPNKPAEAESSGDAAAADVQIEEEDEKPADEEEAAAIRRRAEWARLRMLDVERHRAIAALDVMGQYGSKITFLIKHLQWYRLTRPDMRHVVFSNWADSLHIVEGALRMNHIKYVSFDANSKKNDVVEKFHADPSISVFLLHAERESAGLTLTSCGVVHLLEPVLQHSFELQAIGRVDRLGQKKETEVYCYATLETVESRILCQAVRNGASIYLADEGDSDRAVDKMLNVASAARGGGDLAADTANSTANSELFDLIL